VFDGICECPSLRTRGAYSQRESDLNPDTYFVNMDVTPFGQMETNVDRPRVCFVSDSADILYVIATLLCKLHQTFQMKDVIIQNEGTVLYSCAVGALGYDTRASTQNT
jgi:hypothetical protein